MIKASSIACSVTIFDIMNYAAEVYTRNLVEMPAPVFGPGLKDLVTRRCISSIWLT